MEVTKIYISYVFKFNKKTNFVHISVLVSVFLVSALLISYLFCNRGFFIFLIIFNLVILDHGAMFVMNSKIIGFFSWGDICGRGVPLIILNFLHFREWFESIAY